MWLVVAVLLFAPFPLSAQSALAGIVREDSTGRPLASVEVLVEGTSARAVTGPNGRYAIAGLAPGSRVVLFRLIGFLPLRLPVRLAAGDTTRANALMVPSTVVLDSIVVAGRQPGPRGIGVEAFEERRKMGFGKFYDSTDLRRSEHLRLGDLLRRKGGVEVRMGMIDSARASIAFNPYRRDPLSGALNCAMQVYLDGVPMGRGGRLSENRFDLGFFDPANLEAIEVYTSAAEVPPEYSGPTADCGVILLWSRRGP
ncbi:MAG TPA: carboxypeptidase regulatory-like domain-containing protein [Gemmatimonadales bacterium]|nr:carboxypeptidase regulatory-like domain-containing protein [Gemmatimonadales bacterium]